MENIFQCLNTGVAGDERIIHVRKRGCLFLLATSLSAGRLREATDVELGGGALVLAEMRTRRLALHGNGERRSHRPNGGGLRLERRRVGGGGRGRRGRIDGPHCGYVRF